MEKRQELYKGKAKTVYATDDPRHLVMHYRDDVSAFDGAKLAKLERKGETNNKFNAFIMGKLAAAGVPTHFIRRLNMREQLIREVEIVPLEVVIRNVAAGSLSTRLGIEVQSWSSPSTTMVNAPAPACAPGATWLESP